MKNVSLQILPKKWQIFPIFIFMKKQHQANEKQQPAIYGKKAKKTCPAYCSSAEKWQFLSFALSNIL
ncbi:hypothetical protein [uncultured Prevotella sp.]|uniref:hypothetical protein n=1 Tax=uncultured Prevotella sp. TaxID=159272 RepID=UPI00262C7B57|nr:hypothetical protein [uncultured Prevotella sp.]